MEITDEIKKEFLERVEAELKNGNRIFFASADNTVKGFCHCGDPECESGHGVGFSILGMSIEDIAFMFRSVIKEIPELGHELLKQALLERAGLETVSKESTTRN